MTKSYNEFFNAEQKQKNELVYACGGGYAVSFSHLSTQEEIDAMYEELKRRSRCGNGLFSVFEGVHTSGLRYIL